MENSVTRGVDTFQLVLRSITCSFTLAAQFVGVENISTISSLLPHLVLGTADRETEKLKILDAFLANRLPARLAPC
jgi:hypothetical protein